MNYLIILFYILQRFFEIYLNAVNEKKLIKKYRAELILENEVKVLKLFHALWFFALLTESVYHGKIQNPPYVFITAAVLVLAQVIRFHSISMLGEYWTVQIFRINNQPICTRGLYRFIRHPNYLAVLIEFIALPLILGCPYTLVIGFLLKIIILKRRILYEEENLGLTSSYNKINGSKKRFIPGLF